MTPLFLSFVIALAAIAVLVHFSWPSRDAWNVIRAARQQKAQRTAERLATSQLMESAQRGDAACQYVLGLRYATGDSLPVDFTKALVWFERAAANNVTDAIYCLGLHHQHGRGTKVDVERARDCYERAANLGSTEAQCNLGILFLNGLGVEMNRILALSWFLRSAAQGNDRAAENIELLLDGSCDLSPSEQVEADRIKVRAVSGDTDAMIVFGWMNLYGYGTPLDRSAGVSMWKRAQKAGHVYVHTLLARLK